MVQSRQPGGQKLGCSFRYVNGFAFVVAANQEHIANDGVIRRDAAMLLGECGGDGVVGHALELAFFVDDCCQLIVYAEELDEAADLRLQAIQPCADFELLDGAVW